MKASEITDPSHSSGTKAVLATGRAEYIGLHTCKALNKAGHMSFAYDNLIYGHREEEILP